MARVGAAVIHQVSHGQMQMFLPLLSVFLFAVAHHQQPVPLFVFGAQSRHSTISDHRPTTSETTRAEADPGSKLTLAPVQRVHSCQNCHSRVSTGDQSPSQGPGPPESGSQQSQATNYIGRSDPTDYGAWRPWRLPHRRFADCRFRLRRGSKLPVRPDFFFFFFAGAAG
ncbi:hypothetical protein B0T14DRAFT_148838 [Immersiella caudata]|uniref:Secreted protein n=1 Tax=Immersiella caudata TaxID=314043 RepID=A0AA39WVP8_9PEZI|nr:hypothetical protein B0T14DRAFT_148838 [Immersiella caudata]